MKSNFLIYSGVAMLVAGCASTPVEKSELNDPVVEMLLDSSARIEKELATISEYEQARNPSRTVASSENEDLNRRMATLEFDGDLSKIVEHLANKIGYSFSETNKPITSVSVSLNQRNSTVLRALRVLAAQAGPKVNVIVSETKKTIEVEYL